FSSLPNIALNRKYSNRPQTPAANTDRNQMIERVMDFSAGMPVEPRRNINAPSRKPIPEMESGKKDTRIMIGTKIRSDRKEVSREIPFARTYTDKIVRSWISME